MGIDYSSLLGALRAGGLDPGDIVAGSMQRCKVEGDRGGKKGGAYRLFDDEHPTCAWWNWKAGTSGVWVASDDRPLTDDERNRQRQRIEQAKQERSLWQAREWQRNADYLAWLWRRGRVIAPSCPAGLYLAGRGLAVPTGDALRYVGSLGYWGGDAEQAYPAMLGAVTSQQGQLLAVHRTYLSQDGHKAPVPTVKKLTRTAGPLAGASIKIGTPSPRPDGRLGLGVAEGIETAIAASMLSGLPVWSCVSAHGLATFNPPPDLHYLYIFADRDDNETGQEAAETLSRLAIRAGLVVRVLLPDAVGDWVDELIARRATV